MKSIGLVLFTFLCLSGWAQSIMTSSWVPTAGQGFTTIGFNPHISLNPGNSGNSVTWDLSAIDTAGGQTSITTYINPSTAPQSLQFPGATVCAASAGGSDYSFDRLSGNVYQAIGEYLPNSGQPWLIEYTKPKDLFHFPMTYQSSFVDTASFALYVGGNAVDTQLAVLIDSVSIDGFGTLITRAGTFDSVLRVHYVLRQTDTDYVLASTSTIYTSMYAWVSSSYPGMNLANITYDSASVGSPAYFGYYSFVTPDGIKPIAADAQESWSISPQPASDIAHILLHDPAGNSLAHLSIRDVSGQLLMASDFTLSADKDEIAFSVADLPDGVYTASLHISGLLSSKKFIVRH